MTMDKLPLKRVYGKIFEAVKTIYRWVAAILSGVKENHAIWAAFATVVIAVYAMFTYGLQREVMKLQALQIAMSTEPALRGSTRGYMPGKYESHEFFYRTINCGGDTAWSIFQDMQVLIVSDTLLVTDAYYLAGDIVQAGVFKGDFSLLNPLPPSGTLEQGFNSPRVELLNLAGVLKGVVLLRCNSYYWGNSPVRRFELTEYFVYGKESYFPYQNDLFEKVSGHDADLSVRIAHLENTFKTAVVTSVRHISRPAFYDKMFGLSDVPGEQEPLLLLINPCPPLDWVTGRWTFSDTLILANDSLIDFLEYRRRFPEFGEYEQSLPMNQSK